MNVFDTQIHDVKLIQPQVFSDERGYFLETFQQERYEALLGCSLQFVQDNYSRSKKGVLRGLHFQKTQPQGKLIRVCEGEIFDVVFDRRVGSPSFGQWIGCILSSSNHHQLWVPPGLAHGFLVLSESADVEYKCTTFYNPSDEGAIRWDDPEIGIEWPLTGEPLVSEKDQNAPFWTSIK
ncbi:dTDP-4-dehydrorhamnose 3,5-epimerase [Pseudoalteromonas xiamenensis]|uniref:dTDP-4-dehydrorhamnose 3,5-epimerase n=1 Tax=Pseudoalteromonas xiamenensis TaxID=882626 RepID=UPI0035E5101E